MKDILKYLFFLVLGIIFYILLNGKDGFSVGIPEYLLTIDNSIISIDTTIYSDHPETWSTSESNKVMKINDNRYYVYGNDIDKARRNFDVYIANRQSGAGGAGGAIGGGDACSTDTGSDEIVIRDLMTPATREYLSGPGSNWISTTMGFGSAMDEYLLTCIKALITSRGGYGKQVVFVGQAYFILQSLFFINSTLIFFDINIHLLEAMKTIIDNFKDMTSFDDLFSNMKRINLREVYESQSDLRKVKELLSIDNERILFQRCKENFRNNTYVLCEASITDEPLLDYLKNYELDYFSVTNLPVYVIPNFWETINRLQTNNPNLLFMATDGVATNQIIFQYDNSQISIFTTNNPNIFDMQQLLGGKGWLDRITSFYAQYDFVKYVYINRNEELLTLKNTL
jgi:hypothetical protein